MNLLILFIVLNIANVILQTAKSICTVKCGKTVAATANAIAYGLYTVVIIYTVCDLPLWEKIIVVAITNFIGVYVVKMVEQKLSKEKLWKVEMAIPGNKEKMFIIEEILDGGIAYNVQTLDDWYVFNCYCFTKEETAICQKICKKYDGKISAYESAPLC